MRAKACLIHGYAHKDDTISSYEEHVHFALCHLTELEHERNVNMEHTTHVDGVLCRTFCLVYNENGFLDITKNEVHMPVVRLCI